LKPIEYDPRLPDLLAKKFINRSDVKAVQWSDGAGYNPLRGKPFTYRDLKQHLSGEKSYGHYMVSQDDMSKLGAFDLDAGRDEITINLYEEESDRMSGPEITFVPREAMAQLDHPGRETYIRFLRVAAAGLEAFSSRMIPGCMTATSFSGGKGLHVYVFMPSQMKSDRIRKLLSSVMGKTRPTWEPLRGDNFWHTPNQIFPGIEIELFPKQSKISDLGNLMRLPLGRHNKTKMDAFFIDTNARETELLPANAFETLSR